MRQVFSRARAAAPAIVFFDEVDAMAVRRKGLVVSLGTSTYSTRQKK